MLRKLWMAILAAIGVIPVVSCGGNNGWTAPDLSAVKPAPPAITGTFEMTFAADTGCADLPAPARSRTYTATVRGDAPARLTGAKFVRAEAAYPYWNVVYVSGTAESADF